MNLMPPYYNVGCRTRQAVHGHPPLSGLSLAEQHNTTCSLLSSLVTPIDSTDHPQLPFPSCPTSVPRPQLGLTTLLNQRPCMLEDQVGCTKTYPTICYHRPSSHSCPQNWNRIPRVPSSHPVHTTCESLRSSRLGSYLYPRHPLLNHISCQKIRQVVWRFTTLLTQT